MENTLFPANNWKRVLLKIYSIFPNLYYEENKIKFSSDNHDLAKRLKISGEELWSCLIFLDSNGLVEIAHLGKERIVSFTEKGLDFALEIEKQFREIREKKRFEVLQWLMITLTGVLALASVVNIFF